MNSWRHLVFSVFPVPLEILFEFPFENYNYSVPLLALLVVID